MLRFNANLFRLAFTCASNEETRYYLKGVFVEPHAQGGVTLTATDGHRLVVIRDENGHADETAIIALGDGLKQCKPKRGERRDIVIATGESTAYIMQTIVDDAGELQDSPIATAYSVRVDGSYPDYRRVVPRAFAAKGSPGFQGRYLAHFGDMACELATHQGYVRAKNHTGAHQDNLRILCSDDTNPEGAPALVLFPSAEFAFGVLMPVRLPDRATTDAPSWFRAA